VLNNPLSYTDPSGYFFKSIGKFFKKYGRTLASIAITVAAPQLSGKLWVSIIAGAAAGYVSSGSLKGALIGAFSGAVFHGIGDYFQGLQHSNGLAAASTVKGFGHFQGIAEGVAYARNATLSLAQSIGKVIAHGTAGGVMSELQGGKFAHGFVSAGVTQAFAKHIDNIGGGSRSIGAVAGRVSAAALVGGTASELSGGKFVNGAVTGAFSRAFNDEIHVEEERTWSSYLPGTEAGESAALYWADIAVNSEHPLAFAAHVPGVFASMWTDQTAVSTAFTLGTAGTGSIGSRFVDWFNKGYGFSLGRFSFWYKLPRLNGRLYFLYRLKNGKTFRFQRGNWGKKDQPWYKQEYLKLPGKTNKHWPWQR
jgi:hypothetical protein